MTHGQKPALIRALNALGRRVGGGAALDAQSLQQSAAKRTGLSDFGSVVYQEGLSRLVEELNTSARLSPLGRWVAYFNLLDYLEVRLKLTDYRNRHPAVAAQTVSRPLIILGLPRTGTTILYELLAQDPAHRSPASWEVAKPVPPAQAETYRSDRRIRSVAAHFKISEWLAPGFQAIHAIGARLPQECVYLFASAFVSEQFGYMYDVPAYRRWLLEQDMVEGYRWHHAFLQHLQSEYVAERWLLKTPSHLAYLDALVEQYPDAALVWTHRDPLTAVSSFSSLVTTLRGAFSDSVDPSAVGAWELEHQSHIVSRGMAQRQSLPEGQVCDISYAQIQEDPIAAVKAIYAFFDFELSTATEAQMRQYLQHRPRDLYGEHRYSADAHGISEAAVEMRFADYRARYAAYLR